MAKRVSRKGKTRRKAPRRAAKTRPLEIALAGFAHDIRTPLTGIIAIGELLSTSELGERERRWVAALKEAAEHLVALTTVVVDAARAGVRGFALRRDRFDARALAQSLAASCVARAQAKGIGCKTHIPAAFPGYVIGDPVRLRAAVENLIDNAVKFTERGDVILRMSATRAARDRLRLSFAMIDNGIGMTAAEIKRLFRPFAQANESIGRTFGGFGLGLVLVKRLAEAMGGGLTVKSRAGHGSTFTLTVAVTLDRDATDVPNIRGAAEEPAHPVRRGQPVWPRHSQDHPGRARPSRRVRRQRRRRGGRRVARRLRCGADGRGAARHRRARGDAPHPRARRHRRAHPGDRGLRALEHRGGGARARRRHERISRQADQPEQVEYVSVGACRAVRRRVASGE